MICHSRISDNRTEIEEMLQELIYNNKTEIMSRVNTQLIVNDYRIENVDQCVNLGHLLKFEKEKQQNSQEELDNVGLF